MLVKEIFLSFGEERFKIERNKIYIKDKYFIMDFKAN